MRQTGHSLPEIKRLVGCGYGTVWRYIKDVEVFPEFKETLRVKQGGSKERAKKYWKDAQIEAQKIIEDFSDKELLILLAGIYWGEGSKKGEFGIINGDPYLIRTVIAGLQVLGIEKESIRIHVRIFSDMNEQEIMEFWLKFLQLDPTQLCRSEIIPGNGSRKLKYGMCRVRIVKGAAYFKQIMSVIDLIKSSPIMLP